MKEIKYNYDYAKLRGKIREVYGTEKELCKVINRTPAFLSNALTGKALLTIPDVEAIAAALGIDTRDIPIYFFTHRIA